MENKCAIKMENITKRFGSVVANNAINMELREGEILSLLGENGSGKTTLMNMLSGIYFPDEGQIYIHDKPVTIASPKDAFDLGIGMIHQHFKLVDLFTATENIILGLEGKLDLNNARKKVQDICDRYGFDIDPDMKIYDMSVSQKQTVEIVKVLYRGADILILDEPTASLTPQEIEELIEIMHNLAREGKTVILITHKLKEIKAAADYCTIIRQGKYINTVSVADTTEQQLAAMMVGRSVEFKVDKAAIEPGEVALEVHDLHAKDYRNVEVLRGLDLTVRKGEIVGIAGIDGNGQTELVEILTGLKKATHGAITMNGHDAYNKTPRQLFDMGISSIPADRHKHGLVLDFSVEDNLILQNADEKPYSNHGALNFKAIDEHARELIEKYDIRPRGCEHEPAGDLSGGNQQKVIIAREVTNDKDLLIAVNPTRGLDVGAIEYVHKYIVDQRNKHKAVLLVSFELDEVMSLSDRIDVIFEGKIVGSVRGSEADEKKLGLMMAGGSAHEE